MDEWFQSLLVDVVTSRAPVAGDQQGPSPLAGLREVLASRDATEMAASRLYGRVLVPAELFRGRLPMTESEWVASADPAAMLRWLTARDTTTDFTDPRVGRQLASARKLRLFACACARQIWDRLTDDATCRCDNWCVYEGPTVLCCPDCSGTGRVNRSRRAVETAERFADGEINEAVRSSEHQRVWDIVHGASNVLVGDDVLRQVPPQRPNPWGRLFEDCGTPATQAAILRCIVNPFWSPPACWWCRGDGQASHEEHYGACTVCGGTGRALPEGQVNRTVRSLASAIYVERAFDRLPVLADALEEAGCTDASLLGHCRGDARLHARGCRVLDLLLGKA